MSGFNPAAMRFLDNAPVKPAVLVDQLEIRWRKLQKDQGVGWEGTSKALMAIIKRESEFSPSQKEKIVKIVGGMNDYSLHHSVMREFLRLPWEEFSKVSAPGKKDSFLWGFANYQEKKIQWGLQFRLAMHDIAESDQDLVYWKKDIINYANRVLDDFDLFGPLRSIFELVASGVVLNHTEFAPRVSQTPIGTPEEKGDVDPDGEELPVVNPQAKKNGDKKGNGHREGKGVEMHAARTSREAAALALGKIPLAATPAGKKLAKLVPTMEQVADAIGVTAEERVNPDACGTHAVPLAPEFLQPPQPVAEDVLPPVPPPAWTPLNEEEIDRLEGKEASVYLILRRMRSEGCTMTPKQLQKMEALELEALSNDGLTPEERAVLEEAGL